jgi:hypothetical protein
MTDREKKIQETIMWLEELIEDNMLDYGNAEVVFENSHGDGWGGFYMTVEAPNNSIITLDFRTEEDPKLVISERDFVDEFISSANAFDADERFNDVWDREFAQHNGFTPSQFLRMLQKDQLFFEEKAREFFKNGIGGAKSVL